MIPKQYNRVDKLFKKKKLFGYSNYFIDIKANQEDRVLENGTIEEQLTLLWCYLNTNVSRNRDYLLDILRSHKDVELFKKWYYLFYNALEFCDKAESIVRYAMEHIYLHKTLLIRTQLAELKNKIQPNLTEEDEKIFNKLLKDEIYGNDIDVLKKKLSLINKNANKIVGGIRCSLESYYKHFKAVGMEQFTPLRFDDYKDLLSSPEYFEELPKGFKPIYFDKVKLDKQYIKKVCDIIKDEIDAMEVEEVNKLKLMMNE